MKPIIYLIILTLLFAPFIVLAADGIEEPQITRPTVRILNSQNFSLEKEFYPFAEDSKAEGANIATADLNNDGFKEIIVAAGRNEKPLVKIFNYKGEFQFEFLAYAENFRKGLKVVAADLFNDGFPEIITAPNEGGGPHIRIFDAKGQNLFSFFAFNKDLRGGANVSVGDVNGNGQPEILVAAGYGMEPVIKIFDNYTNFIKGFYAFEDTFLGGVNVLAADLDNDKKAEIIAAPALGKEPKVRIFDYNGNLIREFLAYAKGFGGGVNLAASDVDRNGYLDILTGAGYSGGSHLCIFDSQGNPKINPKLFVYENFKGGISIADGDIDNDGITEILAATQTISPIGKYNSFKIIEIDIAQQKLFAYFKGLLEKEFIISTGTWKFPTPLGNFHIYAKVPLTRMSGYYGPNHPENYDLPNVPHVMVFYKNYAIHGAYWHWRFGTRVSHGCVNLKLVDAEWLYKWAHIGTPVKIYSSK
ncbi:MAG TPA: hypothetical protein ENN28_03665 [Candidatus Uhrbacteria bacterium]|nr:hypothetical protein [Candidatus Uhrbacteria bacterium]